MMNDKTQCEIIVNNTAEIIFLIDNKGKFIYTNHSFNRILGYTKEDIQKINYLNIIDKSLVSKCKETFKQVVSKKQEPIKTSTIFITKKGKAIRVGGTVNPITKKNRTSMLVGSFNTIKNDEELVCCDAQEKYRQIFDLSPEAILLLNEKQQIEDINSIVEEWLGISKNKIIGKNIFEIPLIAADSRKEFSNKIETAKRTGKIDSYEIQFQSKGKMKKTGSVMGTCINEKKKKKASILVMIHDVTEETVMRDELKNKTSLVEEMNKQLEKKVKDRTEKLEIANLRVMGLLEQKSRFVNQLAHDLITPLTPIISLLEISLLSGCTKKNNERLSIALQNAKYLLVLLKDILTLAKLDSNVVTFNYEKSNINEIIRKIIISQKIIITQRKINLKKSLEKRLPKLFIDPIKIREVLENIVKNALNAMNDGKSLKIITKKEDTNIVICVKDQGIGIAKENIEQIFEEFFKVDSSRHEHSAGLGLAISKKIIEKHGGHIWAESEGLEKGASFNITLPIASKNIK